MNLSKEDEMVMETIWNNLPKFPDNDHVTFDEAAVKEMWETGFVDETRYSLEEWMKAFEPHKTPEGNYILTKNDLFEKAIYRYKGEIKLPFEPLLINEGKYTDEGLEELINLSIAPSCSYSRERLREFFEDFKKRHRGGDGLIKMDMAAKREIADLIYQNPSPTRRREVLFDMIFGEQIEEIIKGTSPILTATPDQAAQVQISAFTQVPSEVEKASVGLKSIEKVKERGTAPAATNSPDTSLKKVRRSRKGIRG